MDFEASKKRMQERQMQGNQKWEVIKHDSPLFAATFAALTEDKVIFLDDVSEADVKFHIANLTEVKHQKVSAKGKHDMYQYRGRCLGTNASLLTWGPQLKGSDARKEGSQMAFPVIPIPEGFTALQGAKYENVTIDGVTKKIATTFNLLKAIAPNAFQQAPRKVAEIANATMLESFLKDIKQEKLEAKTATGSDT